MSVAPYTTSWCLVVLQKNTLISAKTGVHVNGNLTGVPLKLSFSQIIPHCIHGHDVTQRTKTLGCRPWYEVNLWDLLAHHVTPKSITSNWPLILQVKDELGDIHVCQQSIVINAALSQREVDHIGHTLQDDVIGLKPPCSLQDGRQGVAAMVVHSLSPDKGSHL